MGEAQKGMTFKRMVADLRRTFRDAFGGYRPELHYMRGPGPKWREKHALAPQSEPALSGTARLPA
jgi:hypothetical protein